MARVERFLLAAAGVTSLSVLVAIEARAEGAITTGVFITSIVSNAIVRIAAIAAGTYIVKLGHDTMIRGVKGEFAFEGSFGKLKGSVPGLLFVLLGSVVVGWALATKHTGQETDASTTSASVSDTSVPPPLPPPPKLDDKAPSREAR